MRSSLTARLGKLETRSGGWWAWKGKPVAEWPDEALLAFLHESTGLPVSAEPIPDAALLAIIQPSPWRPAP